jgi:hypothetical protein
MLVSRYLARDYEGAYLMYLQAGELGYEVAQNNAAFLMDKRLASALQILGAAPAGWEGYAQVAGGAATGESDALEAKGGAPVMDESDLRARLSLRSHWMGYQLGGTAESFIRIGDAYFYGQGGEVPRKGYLRNLSGSRLMSDLLMVPGVPQSYDLAMHWYSKASSADVAQGKGPSTPNR